MGARLRNGPLAGRLTPSPRVGGLALGSRHHDHDRSRTWTSQPNGRRTSGSQNLGAHPGLPLGPERERLATTNGKEGPPWKSKVDWESGRRIDPILSDDGAISIPSVDEEVRKDMDRGASLLNARPRQAGRARRRRQQGPGHVKPILYALVALSCRVS